MKLNDNLTCEIRNKKDRKNTLINNDGNKSIIIGRTQEIEIDGLFNIKNSKIPFLNKDEVYILYNSFDKKNVDDNEDNEFLTIDNDNQGLDGKIKIWSAIKKNYIF